MNFKFYSIILSFLFLTSSPLFSQLALVNKAGYLPPSIKVVYFTQEADSFFIKDKISQAIVYSGLIEAYKPDDPSTGFTTFRGEFSAFNLPGEYFITDKLGNISSSFAIADTAFHSVFTKSLKEFYFQRCGTALLPEHAGVYQHPRCHFQTDATYHSSTDTSGTTSAFGGWHDAGDYGKYVVNAGITVGTLLMAYELFPDRFSIDNLNIPESGNKVPDILDENRYELDWLFKMQKPSGAVFAKLTREQFEGFVMPQTDNTKRYIYQIASTATADFAAVMARAYRVFSYSDPDYANKCLDAAKKAWEYLDAHPQIFPVGGFKNPSGTGTGEYGDGNDSDERLWASAELFESTGEQKYHTYYLNNFRSVGLFTRKMSWPNVGTMANLTYLFGKNQAIDQDIKNEHRTALLSFCNTLVQKCLSDGLNVSISGNEYNWGSNSNVLNNAILLIAGYQLNNLQDFYDAALYQLNYILGINGHDLSFVTGVGDKRAMRIHHRPSASDNINEPVPGMLAGGPNKNISNDPVLQRTFTSSTPPALCYIDDVGSYASNENCLNWNAPLVFVTGFFNNGATTVGVKKNEKPLPTELNLNQNYPNPFNPSTKISFNIPQPELVMLKIYNVLGEEVAALLNEELESGSYEVNFAADGLSSGIYIYTLTAGNFIASRKMILMQ